MPVAWEQKGNGRGQVQGKKTALLSSAESWGEPGEEEPWRQTSFAGAEGCSFLAIAAGLQLASCPSEDWLRGEVKSPRFSAPAMSLQHSSEDMGLSYALVQSFFILCLVPLVWKVSGVEHLTWQLTLPPLLCSLDPFSLSLELPSQLRPQLLQESCYWFIVLLPIWLALKFTFHTKIKVIGLTGMADPVAYFLQVAQRFPTACRI